MNNVKDVLQQALAALDAALALLTAEPTLHDDTTRDEIERLVRFAVAAIRQAISA